ncbi:MAG TPA: hypothetical protein VMG12_35270 [Polyangiaceae bacterium]|nr:hypothetical protein [Polyangiaceae bacterium]
MGTALVALASGFAGCGSDDDGGSRGGSFADITSAIESPTGTVDATTAADVGVEFEKAAQANIAGGMRRDAQTAQSSSGTVDCPAGGNLSAAGSGDQSSGHSTATYNGCCVSANCCLDGSADIYFSTQQGAAYTYCGSYDLSYACEGTTTQLRYEGCLSAMGKQVYVIEVEGDSYAVSGTYSNGSGTLEITGENGTWTCTYSSGSGSCSGTGATFTF